jgi:hypothetical protein
LLQKRGLPFLVPLGRRGQKGQGNAWLFEPTLPLGWYDYTWTTLVRRRHRTSGHRRRRGALSVTVRVCVARQPKDGKPLVYASWGLGKGWSVAQVVATYRRRFGIEAGYRQLGQCLARTSSRREGLRLLLVGLALLLCNLWALLHDGAFSTGPVSERQPHLGLLRLAELSAALAAVIAAEFGGWVSEWPTQRPLPQPIAMFQTT